MSKLRELEKRLREEPDNLGLRVMVAGALREAGRQEDAVELYRSVAIVYRDQGRTQQAIAVCRSILEIAPGDTRCHALLAALIASQASRASQPPSPRLGSEPATEIDTPPPVESMSAPARRSSLDETPLPGPLPYHVADPTTRGLEKFSEANLARRSSRNSRDSRDSGDVTDPEQLPAAEGTTTRPGDEPATFPEVAGLASAARRISASLIASGDRDDEDISSQLDTRQRPRIASKELEKITRPPPTVPVELLDPEEEPTPLPMAGIPRTRESEDEDTRPRELPVSARPPPPPEPRRRNPPPITRGPLTSAFFAPLPSERRGAVLTRFHRRYVTAGATVIRQGETGHALIVVARGRLALRVERADGVLLELGAIAAGDYVGEAALLARSPAPAHVVANIDSDLLLLAPRDFYEIVGAFPALWAQLKEVAERRNRELEARLKHVR